MKAAGEHMKRYQKLSFVGAALAFVGLYDSESNVVFAGCDTTGCEFEEACNDGAPPPNDDFEGLLDDYECYCETGCAQNGQSAVYPDLSPNYSSNPGMSCGTGPSDCTCKVVCICTGPLPED